MPAAATAAAAVLVEKMHDAHRTSAPSTSALISTAVWMVMWSEPVMRAMASGFDRHGAHMRRASVLASSTPWTELGEGGRLP